jgi:hypothetical protein
MLRTTRFSLLTFIALAVFASLVCAGPATAASEPAPIMHLVSASEPFTQQQRQQIRAWAAGWARDLASGDPDRVNQGRRRLLEPLRATTVRPLFREAYSEELIREVESILNGDAELFVAVNALQVAAMLGTESAARLMTTRADPVSEPRSQVRLWAVHGVRTVFRQGTLDEGRYPGILRDLSRAASRETDWIVLQRHFDALGSAGTENARERQIALLNEILDRIERSDSGPNELIRAVHYAVVAFREQFINLRRSEQLSFGTQAAPVIARVFDIASKHWEKVDDANVMQSYGGAVQISETMLGIIDDLVRGQNAAPRTNIVHAWNNRNRQSFLQETERWTVVLRQPPYSDRR